MITRGSKKKNDSISLSGSYVCRSKGFQTNFSANTRKEYPQVHAKSYIKLPEGRCEEVYYWLIDFERNQGSVYFGESLSEVKSITRLRATVESCNESDGSSTIDRIFINREEERKSSTRENFSRAAFILPKRLEVVIPEQDKTPRLAERRQLAVRGRDLVFQS